MKKLIFTFLTTFAIFSLFAQIDREIVIIEVGTGTGCPYCPGAAMGLHDLYTNGDPVAGIEYHNYNSGDPFNTPEAPVRCSYYGISGYPTAQFDGEYNEYVGGSNSNSLYGSYLPIVNARMDMDAFFTSELAGENNGDTYNITVTCTKNGQYDGTNLVLHVVLTETDIPYNWQGQTAIDYTQRLMVPGASGTPISFPTNNSTVEVELSFTFDNTWVKDNCELICFLQDNDNKNILHGGAVMLPDLDPGYPTWLADFEADPTDICESGTAHFHDNSIGEVIQYQWTFDGGLPETSGSENPNVYYSATGEYDVRLVIYDGTRYDTSYKTNFITVHELPDVAFGDVGELCNEDWDPYTLTQGSPEGGVYSGEYVTEGMYFHPTESGVGEFEVTYTYDESGCENYAMQTITVVNCVGVKENAEAVSLEVYPNPSYGVFNININATDLNNADLRVIDIVGKVIYEQTELSVQGSDVISIDLNEYPSGIYFVQIKSETKSVSKKIFLK